MPKSLNRSCRFWGSNQKTRCSGFKAKPLTNYRPWFWGQTKKPELIVSSCTVQTTHNVTRPLDRPATEYSTCAWPSPILCTRSPTPVMILVAAHHATSITCTPRDNQTRFSTWNKDKGKTNKTSRIQIQTKGRQWVITNRTKVLITWFLRWTCGTWR
jgi:hypothetical protein